MPPERVERKLAAILAADVAGYSRLMGADEESTLARLKAYRRELIDPKIAEHRGRTAQMLIAASLAHLGRRDEAHDLLGRARAQSLDPRYQQMPWTRPEDNALRLEGVRLAAGEAT